MASASAISERATATCSPSPARNRVLVELLALQHGRVEFMLGFLHHVVQGVLRLLQSTAVRRILLRLHQGLVRVRADDVAFVLLHQCDLDLLRQLLHLAHRMLEGHGRV